MSRPLSRIILRLLSHQIPSQSLSRAHLTSCLISKTSKSYGVGQTTRSFNGHATEKRAPGLIDVCKSTHFTIEHTKYSMRVNRFSHGHDNNIVAIIEKNKENDHTRHIWISIPTAKGILEKLSKSNFRTYYNDRSIIDFEKQELISLEYKKMTAQNQHYGKEAVCIVRYSLNRTESSGIIVPREGVPVFQQKLAKLLSYYEINQKGVELAESLCRPTIFTENNRRFFMSICRFKVSGDIFVSISEKNKVMQNERHIWLGLTAAQTLLEKLNTIDPENPTYTTSFMDEERKNTLGIEISHKEDGNIVVSLISRHVDDPTKLSNVNFLLDKLPSFREKLAALFVNYEKTQNPDQPSSFADLSNRDFEFGTMKYLLRLLEEKESKNVVFYVKVLNTKSGLKTGTMMSIPAALKMYEILKEVKEVVEKHEGRLTHENRIGSSLYDTSYVSENRNSEYRRFVARVDVCRDRVFGDTRVYIGDGSVSGESRFSGLNIRSKGFPTFFQNYEALLKEYGTLKGGQDSVSVTSNSTFDQKAISKRRNPNEDPKLTGEIIEAKDKVLAEIAELKKNWEGTDEEFQQDEEKLLARFAKEAREIFKKHGYLK